MTIDPNSSPVKVTYKLHVTDPETGVVTDACDCEDHFTEEEAKNCQKINR